MVLNQSELKAVTQLTMIHEACLIGVISIWFADVRLRRLTFFGLSGAVRT